jgi:hypothetical protein
VALLNIEYLQQYFTAVFCVEVRALYLQYTNIMINEVCK